MTYPSLSLPVWDEYKIAYFKAMVEMMMMSIDEGPKFLAFN
jgi:hypothetical protein